MNLNTKSTAWDLGRDITHEVLIANLGGYESAKSKLRDNGSLHAERLKKALLEYRRQHNIFEVGDWVVKASRLKDNTLYQIDEIAESKNYVKTKCGVFIDAPMFKHATDAEIKAGKRLEVV